MRALFANRSVRPYLLLVVITLVLWALDRGQGRFLTTGTAYSVLQQFATIGPIALGLGLSYLNALPYWGYAQRALEDLRNEIGESCALAVLDETEIVYALRLPARRILSANLGIGSRLPAHLVSLGRVMLACCGTWMLVGIEA